jgi:hypothetical protein
LEIFAFLLIGGIWAAFLLPSFFDSRRRAPLNTTRNFARSKDLLASVSATNNGQALKARRLAAVRRRRVLVLLSIGALGSLALAVLQGSFAWLMATIVFDIALAAYVAVLMQIKATRHDSAPVLSLVPTESMQDEQHHTVRVVAG